MQPEVYQIGKWCFWHNDQNGWYTVVEISPVWEPANEVSVEHVMRALANLKTQFEAPSELWQGIAHNIWQRLEAGEIEGIKVSETCWLVRAGYWYLIQDGGQYRVEPCQEDQPSYQSHRLMILDWIDKRLINGESVVLDDVLVQPNTDFNALLDQSFLGFIAYIDIDTAPIERRVYTDICYSEVEAFDALNRGQGHFYALAQQADKDKPERIVFDASTPIGQLMIGLFTDFWHVQKHNTIFAPILPYLFTQSDDSQEQEES